MTPQEFAGKIKSKYPQYASMNDDDLTQRMLKKYPQYASQVGSEKSFLGINRGNMGQAASTFARPTLEGLGAIGGGALGMAAPVPGGAAMGGAIGFGAGKSAADLLERFMGQKKTLQNIQQAGQEAAGNLQQGAQNELMGMGTGAVLGALKKPIGKFAGNMGRAISGVNEKSGERLFNDPGAFLSPGIKKAGEKLGAVRKGLGINTSRTDDEILDSELKTSRSIVRDTLEKMRGVPQKLKKSFNEIISGTAEKDLPKSHLEIVGSSGAASKTIADPVMGGMGREIPPVEPGKTVVVRNAPEINMLGGSANPAIGESGNTVVTKNARPVDMLGGMRKETPKKISLSELVKASQSMDDIIEATPTKQRNRRAALFDLKNKIVDEIKNVAPKERVAAKEYSRSALASDFRKFLPVTKSGDVSVTRTFGLPMIEGSGKFLAGAPAILTQSPFLSGSAISASGAGYKAMQNPTVRRGIIAALRGLRKKDEDSNP